VRLITASRAAVPSFERMSKELPCLALALALGVLAGAAPAQADMGARVGASIDPDQFYVGVDGDLGELVDRLTFRVGADLGLGDPDTMLALNVDFVFHPAGRVGRWRPYLGVGPALNLFLGDDSDAKGGVNFLAGLEHRDRFFVEVRVGVIDSPDFKIGAGVRF
jgi:hypothetical protein